MSQSPHVVEVSRADFPSRVIGKSRELAVLVDFWAPWCAPCRMLAPILDKLADEYAGKLLVAKVNTDIEQELAVEHHIRGIPAVKLFRNGAVAGEFVGVQPESTIRALIDRFVPNETDALLERAAALEKAGSEAEAAALLGQAVDGEPNNDRAKIALARLLCRHVPTDNAAPRLQECRKLLDSLSIRASADPEVESIRTRLKLWEVVVDAPALDALERAVRANALDTTARYRLAARLALADNYEAAFDNLLEIVRRDRAYGEDAGRKTLVGLFNLLGSQHPLTVKYRGLLSRTLN